MAEHRIQVRVDDEKWDRARRAARANGFTKVAPLVEMLLERECERLGLTSKPEAAVEGDEPGEEHRIQIRVDERRWEMALELASRKGFSYVSDLARHLLEEAFQREESGTEKRGPTRGK